MHQVVTESQLYLFRTLKYELIIPINFVNHFRARLLEI